MIDTLTLRKKILDLAICGKISIQDLKKESAQKDFHELDLIKKNLLDNKIVKKEKIAKVDNDDIPFEIPDNWKWCQLADLCKSVTDGTHKTPTYIEQGIPFLSVKNISSGFFDLEDVKYIGQYEHEELLRRCKPERGDILFCRIGTLGKAIEINFEPSFSIFVSLGLIKPLDSYLSKYLVNVFNSGYGDCWIKKNKAGDSMHAAKINLDVLRSFMVPMPPREEQERIVEKLKAVFALLDQIDNLQQQYLSDLEVLKSKIIDAGIQGKLTEQLSEDGDAEELFAAIQEEKDRLIKEKKIKKEKAVLAISDDEIPFEIPHNWKWVRLVDLCSKISSGNTPAGGSKGGAYVSEGFCFFREQNIYNEGIHNDGMVYITEELLNTRPNSTVLPKDILLNITGGSIGRCALIPDDFSRGSINQHILIIRVVDPRIRFYVHKCLCSPYYQKLIRGNVVGDKDGFSAGRCKNTLIPLPPISEQNRIVNKIDELLSLI